MVIKCNSFISKHTDSLCSKLCTRDKTSFLYVNKIVIQDAGMWLCVFQLNINRAEIMTVSFTCYSVLKHFESILPQKGSAEYHIKILQADR